MKQNNKSPTFAVAMAVVIIFVKAWTCAAQTTPASLVDDEVLRFKKKAEKVGCVVQEGLPVKTNLNDLYCNGLMWAPLYPNPNAPYISSMLPHVPGQANPVVSNGSFRLREDEAIVVIGVQKARGCGPGSCVLFVPGTLLEAGIGVAAGRKRPQCRVGRSHPWLEHFLKPAESAVVLFRDTNHPAMPVRDVVEEPPRHTGPDNLPLGIRPLHLFASVCQPSRQDGIRRDNRRLPPCFSSRGIWGI